MPKKILLADDSITIQKVVELTFSDGDYEVIATNNGAKAIQRLAEVRPDIVLSDIIMPEKNGYEVCEYVKSHPEFRHIPVILLTGTFEPFDPDRAEKAGCDAVVTKPFESQSLIHKVEELIAQSVRQAPAAEPIVDHEIVSPAGAADPFLTDDSVHTAPTFEMPAFQEPVTSAPPMWSTPAFAVPSEYDRSPFDSGAPISTPAPLSPSATEPFSSPQSSFAESSFSDPIEGAYQPEVIHEYTEHSSDSLFESSAPVEREEELPLSPPPSWGVSATTAGEPFDDSADDEPEIQAEEPPLFTPRVSEPLSPEPAWSPAAAADAAAEDPNTTKMIPKLTLDDLSPVSEMSSHNNAASSFGSSTESSFGGESGETKMIPKLNFDDIQRMREAAAPSFDDAASAEVTPFSDENETKVAAKPSLEEIQQMREREEAARYQQPSSFTAHEPEVTREAEIIPFDAAEREEAQSSGAQENAPSPMFRTSESPFESEFEMPDDIGPSIPLVESTSSAPQEEDELSDEPLMDEAPIEDEPIESEPIDEAPPEEVPLAASAEQEPLEEMPLAASSAPTSVWEEAEEEPAQTPLLSPSVWSATEPQSITPEPPAFAEVERAATLPPIEAAAPNTATPSVDPGTLSEETIERIARRVVELMSAAAVQKIAWEIVPDLAEMIVKERIRSLENEEV